MITMKPINRIENVWAFKPTKERDILWVLTMERKLRGLSPDNKVLFSEDRYSFYDLDVFPAGLVCTTGEEPQQTFFMRNGQLELCEYTLHIPGLTVGDKFYCYTVYKGGLGYSRVDKRTLEMEVFWPDPFAPDGIKLVIGDKFVSVKRSFLSMSAFADGVEIVRHEFAGLMDGVKSSQYGNMVSHNGYLYFYVVNEKRPTGVTFCMEEATGKIVNKWENIGGNLFLLGDTIYNAYLRNLEVLDTRTGNFSKISLEEELGPLSLRIRSQSSVYTQEGLLYFIDGHWERTNRMGIIDLATQKLIWNTEATVNDGIHNCIDRILVDDNRLYALATDRVVHIFQKE